MDAKALRTANKEKAHRLAGGGDSNPGSQDVDPPADKLNADVKTGARPISKPKFKRGGVVPGANAKHHAGRPARKAGGGCGESYVNRDVKEANEDRDGKKHIGGWKKGGAAKRPGKLYGGGLYGMETKPTGTNGVAAMVETKKGKKHGGAAKKANGGIILNDQDIRKPGVTGVMPPLDGGKTRGMRPGTEVEETVTAKAKAPMFAKSNYSGVTPGNSVRVKDYPAIAGLGKNFEGMIAGSSPEGVKVLEKAAAKGAKAPAASAATARPGRQDGGRVAKGKTNINIIIAPQGGKAPDASADQPVPPDMPPPPPPMMKPPAMPAAAPPGPPAGLAAALGAGPPHAGAPLMRKDGGKVPHMEFGAGGGKGRLEKIKEYGDNAKA
jgi:hypothetical protein